MPQDLALLNCKQIFYVGNSNTFSITLPVGDYYTYVSAFNYAGEYSPTYAEFKVLNLISYTESSVAQKEKVHTVETELHNISSGKIIVIGYKNGAVADLETRDYTQENETFVLEGDIDEIKIMVWDSLSGLVPVCEAEVITKSKWLIE